MKREKYDHYRYDGSMDIKKRNASIAGFKAPSRAPKIFLVSLKAGGVGLNVSVPQKPLVTSKLIFFFYF
jgi:DNA repair protein RAD5